MKFQSLVLILVVLFASAATNQAISTSDSSLVNISDPHVIEIANFALTEYNKKNNEVKLKYEKVINGISAIIDDETNYCLTLAANNGSSSNNYGADVLEKPSKNYTLGFFARLND
ncbi:unnamed protein product [Trifolium pratense]|uniref:Uncharacterized protein n=1 Tax=Trifolium pratense TaxID=57577 RepID=A0ACB0K7W5_TRIPR|nr:unnamed protein product [Trifolium pratense]